MQSLILHFLENDKRVEDLHDGPNRDEHASDDGEAALPRARDAETQEAEAEGETSIAAAMQLCGIPVPWQIF